MVFPQIQKICCVLNILQHVNIHGWPAHVISMWETHDAFVWHWALEGAMQLRKEDINIWPPMLTPNNIFEVSLAAFRSAAAPRPKRRLIVPFTADCVATEGSSRKECPALQQKVDWAFHCCSPTLSGNTVRRCYLEALSVRNKVPFDSGFHNSSSYVNIFKKILSLQHGQALWSRVSPGLRVFYVICIFVIRGDLIFLLIVESAKVSQFI